MGNVELLLSIKIASGVLTIFFGIVAVLTETREKGTNKLTNWGKIAIVGIALLGTFTIIENIVKRIQENEDEIAKIEAKLEEEERIRKQALEAAARFDKNSRLQEENILLATQALERLDTSLDNQKEINKQQSNSLDIQLHLQSQQSELGKSQIAIYNRIKKSQYAIDKIKVYGLIRSKLYESLKQEILEICMEDFKRNNTQDTYIKNDSLGIEYSIDTNDDGVKYVSTINFRQESILLDKLPYFKSFCYGIGLEYGFKAKLNNEVDFDPDSLDFIIGSYAYNEKGNCESLLNYEMNYIGKSRTLIRVELSPESGVDSDRFINNYTEPDHIYFRFSSSRIDPNIKKNRALLSLYDLSNKYLIINTGYFGISPRDFDIVDLRMEFEGMYQTTLFFNENDLNKTPRIYPGTSYHHVSSHLFTSYINNEKLFLDALLINNENTKP